jgi:hypothetical protein
MIEVVYWMAEEVEESGVEEGVVVGGGTEVEEVTTAELVGVVVAVVVGGAVEVDGMLVAEVLAL